MQLHYKYSKVIEIKHSIGFYSVFLTKIYLCLENFLGLKCCFFMKGVVMLNLFTVEIVEEKDITVLIPVGYIDAEAMETLKKAFETVKKTGYKKLLFNFSKTRKINSTGMSQILNILQECTNLEILVRFSNLSRINRKLFSMIGINEFGEIFSDESEALLNF